MAKVLQPEGLAALRAVLADHVAHDGVPGLVAAVGCGEEVWIEAFGTSEPNGGGRPVRRDDLFRIASMTKPVGAVAALALVADGTIALADPAERWLPELANRRVLRAPEAPIDDTVPADRPITVDDLLSFRMGYGLLFNDSPTPLEQAAAALDIPLQGAPEPDASVGPDEWLRRFATLPLADQPGTRWRYNTSAQVLGVLLARAADEPLEALLAERVFEPLGMGDTGFSVPAASAGRLGPAHGPDLQGGGVVVLDPADGGWARPPAFPDLAAGLVSTIDDYLAFALCLARGGVHEDRRILPEELVQLMVTPRLTAEQRATGEPVLGGRNWGLGVSVLDAPDDVGSRPGRYGWEGGFGSSWANDPSTGLVGVILTNHGFGGPDGLPVIDDFWRHANAAVAQ